MAQNTNQRKPRPLSCDNSTPQPNLINIENFLADIKLPQLSSTQLHDLNAPFSLPQILKEIDTLPTNKSAGPDGLTGEYYKNFKLILGPHLDRVFDTAAASASFPSEILEALIVTIPKPGKTPDIPQNVRPISLLIFS